MFIRACLSVSCQPALARSSTPRARLSSFSLLKPAACRATARGYCSLLHRFVASEALVSSSEVFTKKELARRMASSASGAQLLVNQPSYKFLKDDLGLESRNYGVYNGKWMGAGQVSLHSWKLELGSSKQSILNVLQFLFGFNLGFQLKYFLTGSFILQFCQLSSDLIPLLLILALLTSWPCCPLFVGQMSLLVDHLRAFHSFRASSANNFLHFPALRV